MSSTQKNDPPFKGIGIVELGIDVSIWDISPNNVKQALSNTPEGGKQSGKIDGFNDIAEFCNSLSNEETKVLLFSITHGNPADQVLEKLQDHLKEGYIILDGGNEHYRNMERRQEALDKRGVAWIGMGASGGYQSARRGLSLSPGGDKQAVQKVLPLLERFAAKAQSPEDMKESPCTAYIGPKGSGHYVKMVHNGIENGMLSALCEAWGIMKYCLEMQNDEIGKMFERWNTEGPLRSTYLIQIGAEICRRKKTSEGDGRGEGRREGGHVLDDVLDKVVQEDDNTEGRGFWSVIEAAARHVSAPTIAARQFLRVASGNRSKRLEVALELISKASDAEAWGIDLATCIRI